ncbi:MAG: serine/threonine-protein phosphatase [Bdellovibrionales bacterium]|nr:serine/threonine-protein phosphatase [Bdellovibrionales bacterium]
MLLEGSENDSAQGSESDLGQGALVPAAITDTGCERELNEDRYAVIESPSGTAWIVCDGMGGQTGGELAAQLALDAIHRDLENLPGRVPEVALKSAIFEANRIIVLRRQNQAFASMGTTIVAALFSGPEFVVGHVGDSRAYLVREGAIQQLTTDHTYVQQLVDAGQIKPEEALSHPQAHILTRCIGAEPGLEVALSKYWLWNESEQGPGDTLLLCSDGLYSLIGENEIASMVEQLPPQRACVKLVELAKQRGGFDNITLVIVPLPGQVRKEPPPGYTPRMPSTAARHGGNISRSRDGVGPSWARIIGILMVLSVLAALGTFFTFVFMIQNG